MVDHTSEALIYNIESDYEEIQFMHQVIAEILGGISKQVQELYVRDKIAKGLTDGGAARIGNDSAGGNKNAGGAGGTYPSGNNSAGGGGAGGTTGAAGFNRRAPGTPILDENGTVVEELGARGGVRFVV